MIYVAVSCGYSTCFAISACDGLCHLTKVMDRVGTPFWFQPIRESLVIRLRSEIDQIHLSIEAQCVTTLLPLVDCHNIRGIFFSISTLCYRRRYYYQSAVCLSFCLWICCSWVLTWSMHIIIFLNNAMRKAHGYVSIITVSACIKGIGK